MAPRKRLDKGKAPMVEDESARRVTRTRATGVTIREAQAEASRVEERLGETQNEVEEMVIEPEGGPARTERPEVAGPGGETIPPTQPQPMMPEFTAMMTMMAGIAQTLQELVQTQRRHVEEPQQVTGPNLRPMNMGIEMGQTSERRSGLGLNMKAFQHMKPPVFKGQRDYRVVNEWIAGMEKAFAYMECPEEHKVPYGTYQLEGEAEQWWQAERQTVPNNGLGMLWVEFKERLFRRYVPASERARRATQFLMLLQGKQTVEEYDAQFRSLARFVPWAQMDSPETAQKFQEGLRLDIREKLAPLMLTKYEDILERARLIEREEEERTRIRERRRVREGEQSRGKRVRSEQSGTVSSGKTCNYCKQVGHFKAECPTLLRKSGGRPPKPNSSQVRETSQASSQPKGSDQRRPPICYACGEPGHLRYNCPTQGGTESVTSRVPPPVERGGTQQRGRGRGPPGAPVRQNGNRRPPMTAVVQATSVQEAQTVENVVTGNLLVCDCMAYVLFDPGASQSFVSSAFVTKANISKCPMHYMVEVSTPLKAVSTASETCHGIPVIIENRKFEADFNCFKYGRVGYHPRYGLVIQV